MKVVEGKLEADGLRFGLVVSRFNEALTSRLEDGAIDCLVRHGADPEAITVFRVPGAWEIPMVAAKVAEEGGSTPWCASGPSCAGGLLTSISSPPRWPRASLRPQ